MTCLPSAYTAEKPSAITAVQTQHTNTCALLSPLYLITLLTAQDTGNKIQYDPSTRITALEILKVKMYITKHINPSSY